MKNYEPFGIITALVTPFKKDKLNLLAFEKLIQKQLDANVNAILLFGTTGEPLSLNYSEKRILFFTAKEIAKNKLPIIAGISEVCTANAVKIAHAYKNWGANALLQITPYYYKCNSSGIYKHFSAVASKINLPVILYNVPARTAYDLTENDNLFKKVCKIKNVVAIKLAENDKVKITSTIQKSSIPILCGCDEINYYALCQGAKGCISVISNAYPKTLKKLYDAILLSHLNEAKKLNEILTEFSKLCLIEPNPIPIKYALSQLLNEDMDLRLPLDIISLKNTDKINDFINYYKELE